MVYKTLTSDQKCGRNPWDTTDEKNALSPTLEWMIGSPPAFHTFSEIPSIKESLPPQITSDNK